MVKHTQVEVCPICLSMKLTPNNEACWALIFFHGITNFMQIRI